MDQPKKRNVDWALEYARKGFHVFPCHYMMRDAQCSCRSKDCGRAGKHPTTKNGVLDATTDVDQIARWWSAAPHFNIGIATGHGGLIVVDIDIAKGKVGDQSLKQLIEDNGELPETLMQVTGSGGLHYFFHTEKPYKNDNTGRIGKDIDCRCTSGYIVAPPSNHYSGGQYKWLNDLPIAEMPDWLGTNLVVDGEEPVAKKGKGKKSSSKVDVTQDAGEKFEEVDTKPHEKLTKGEIVKILKVIPGDERDTWWKVGAALKTELGDDGFDIWDEWSQASDKYDAKIQKVQWRSFKEDNLSVGTIIHFAKENGWRGFDKEAADTPEIRENWIFCVGTKRFIELERMQEFDQEQFSCRFAPNFKRGRAAEHVLRNEQFTRVDAVTYWPNMPTFVEEFGIRKLNMWKPSPLVAKPGDISPFLHHLNYLFPEPDEQQIVLDYMAFQVQRPGQKVHWALLVQGVPGNGKSYLGFVLQCVLGNDNVRHIHSDLLHETFTGWQKNTQFIIVEEVMARGRLELMNKLKPMITEPWCSIREMYKPPYEQPNRFNFLFLTNHKDAIIIDNTDRRYCVLYSPAPPHPDGIEGYYAPLFEWTSNNAGALLSYLLTRDLSRFHPKAHAPMTEGKRELIVESMAPLDSWIEGQVADRAWPFNTDLIIPSDLCTALPDFGLRANPKEVGRAFNRLGYVQLGRNKNGRIWAVRNQSMYLKMTVEQVYQIWGSQSPVPGDDPAAPSDGEIIKSHQNMVKNTRPM